MKIYSFELSSDFAFFNHKETKNNVSFIIPPISTIKGLFGAIIGLKGYHSKNELNDNLKSIDFLESFKDIDISIEIMNDIKYQKYDFNDSTKLDITNKDHRTSQFYWEILYKPKYKIYFKIPNLQVENSFINELIFHLQNKICYFPIYLGKMGFTATINNFKEETNYETIQLNKEYEKLTFSNVYSLNFISTIENSCYSIELSSHNYISENLSSANIIFSYPFHKNDFYWEDWQKYIYLLDPQIEVLKQSKIVFNNIENTYLINNKVIQFFLKE